MVEAESGSGLADEIAMERANTKVMKSQEKRIADKVFNTSNFTAHAITHEWDDASNAVPINDVNTGKKSIRLACGMLPTDLIISYSTYLDLKVCDQIVDRLKYTFPGMDINKLSSQQLAQIFDVERVLVGGAVYDSKAKGLDSTVADLWSKEYAMLTVTDKSRDVTKPCIGKTFLWTEDSASNAVVESYREEAIRSDIFRVRHNVDERFIQSYKADGTVQSNIAAACSYLFTNVTT
jgi:hypothetical protein